jgi:hypothetical protein
VTDAEVLDAIRANHLKANISVAEAEGRAHWDRAWIDRGGTIFGAGPYAKVPVSLMQDGVVVDEIVVRVYPPERLRKRLARDRVPG